MATIHKLIGISLTGLLFLSCSGTDGGDIWIVNADVWGNDKNEVYIAGYNSGCGCEQRGFVKHYDGEAWTTIYENRELDLWSIWSTSSELFATNSSGIVHFKNNEWNQLSLDNPTELSLFDIHGSSNKNVFAVGRGGIILHYDGENLSTMDSGGYAELEGIWVDSSTEAFAVGESGVILHYKEGKWSEMSSGTTMDLNAVWGSSVDNVYAVGGNEEDRGYIIVHYDGTEWKSVKEGGPCHLLGIHGTSSTNIYAVGGFRNGDGVNGAVLRFDGDDWAQIKTDINQFIWSVWTDSGGEVYLVGPDDTKVIRSP